MIPAAYAKQAQAIVKRVKPRRHTAFTDDGFQYIHSEWMGNAAMSRNTRKLPEGFGWRQISDTGSDRAPATVALDFREQCVALLSPLGSEWQVRLLADVGPRTIRTQMVKRRAAGMALLAEWAEAFGVQDNPGGHAQANAMAGEQAASPWPHAGAESALMLTCMQITHQSEWGQGRQRPAA